ncbi:alpha/beta fold hydrolase [Aliikangiella sp. IMCC44359]|uniref:alpha/beta fold hydrolase n=1 Tax=Aliikangiella sp. IMCC44359 TaxID=3459125 RepID=UPI00403B2766
MTLNTQNKQNKNNHTNPSIFAPIIALLLLLLAQLNVNAKSLPKSFKVTVIGDGQPVILIPGLMSDGRVWNKIIDKLATKYEVHQISIAGFAATSGIKDQSLKRVKEELLNYIQNRQLKYPAIIGHSLGGFMAFWLASDSPNLIGDVISIDGLPFIGPVFTQSNQTTVSDLSIQAKQIQQMYHHLTQQQLAQQTQFSIQRQATEKKEQLKIVNMAAQSDPVFVGNAIYTLMNTDLRTTIAKIKSRILLIGAAGAFNTIAQKERAKKLYQQQIAKSTTANLIMNNQSRHFVMLDEPQWLLTQITSFLTTSTPKAHQ